MVGCPLTAVYVNQRPKKYFETEKRTITCCPQKYLEKTLCWLSPQENKGSPNYLKCRVWEVYSFGGEIGSKHAFGVEERSHVRLMDYLASSSLYSSIYRVRHYIQSVYSTTNCFLPDTRGFCTHSKKSFKYYSITYCVFIKELVVILILKTPLCDVNKRLNPLLKCLPIPMQKSV